MRSDSRISEANAIREDSRRRDVRGSFFWARRCQIGVFSRIGRRAISEMVSSICPAQPEVNSQHPISDRYTDSLYGFAAINYAYDIIPLIKAQKKGSICCLLIERDYI